MTEHYTKNTVSAPAWCRKCYKLTRHRVEDGLLGACEVCLARLWGDKPPEPLPAAATQGDLFKKT